MTFNDQMCNTPNQVRERKSMFKKTLAIDFDGVINSYKSGWIEDYFIPDEPVEGAIDFIERALEHFDVVIFSSRAKRHEGRQAMRTWLHYWAKKQLGLERGNGLINKLQIEKFTAEKPAAFVTLDDMAITFKGVFPTLAEINSFKPWYYKERNNG